MVAEKLNKLRLLKQQAFVNGKWVSALCGKTFPVLSPATREVIAHVPEFHEDDISEAISTAHAAFNAWKNTSCKQRSHFLREMHRKMMANEEEIATIMSAECGKSLAESRGEVKYAASYLDWFSQEACRINGDILPNVEQNTKRLILKQPVGVCAMITPWNFPLAMVTRKVGAALATGCTSVLKPSEETPLTALAFAKITEEAGLPEGVMNVITCSKDTTLLAGNLLCTSEWIDKISFTGSTAVGKWLLERSASTVKRVSMELGGNAPFVVFDSADVKLAAKMAVDARFRNTGQTCICPQRFIVQEGVYDKFVRELKDLVHDLKVGNPFDVDTDVTCLINEQGMEKVKRHVKDAIEKGAKLVHGGHIVPEIGALSYCPTILGDCTPSMLCTREETFGPVAAVMKFSTDQEAVEMANQRDSGLAAYLFTRDQAQTWRMMESIRAGMIGVNQSAISSNMIPFGGVGESGMGREGSVYGVDDYLEKKCVTMSL